MTQVYLLFCNLLITMQLALTTAASSAAWHAYLLLIPQEGRVVVNGQLNCCWECFVYADRNIWTQPLFILLISRFFKELS